MDKSLELYKEEERAKLIEIHGSILQLTEHLGKYVEAVKEYSRLPEQLTVEGQVVVKNPIESVTVKNLGDMLNAFEECGKMMKSAISENGYREQKSIEVSNIGDAKASELKVTNLTDIKEYFDELTSVIKQNTPVVNVQKQEIRWPKNSTEAIPVRLSDGKSWINQLVAAMSSGGGSGQEDKLADYQICERDDAGSTKYYGYANTKGAWYIMRESSNGSYRYVKGMPDRENGGGLFSDAWTDRANLDYKYIYEVW